MNILIYTVFVVSTVHITVLYMQLVMHLHSKYYELQYLDGMAHC